MKTTCYENVEDFFCEIKVLKINDINDEKNERLNELITYDSKNKICEWINWVEYNTRNKNNLTEQIQITKKIIGEQDPIKKFMLYKNRNSSGKRILFDPDCSIIINYDIENYWNAVLIIINILDIP